MTTPDLDSTPLKNYVQAYENLTQQNFKERLGRCFASDVFFKDPFNEAHGKEAALRIFEHMYQQVSDSAFEVLTAVPDEEGSALLYWRFKFRRSGKHDLQVIEGMSRVVFNERGLVGTHIDYWDAGENVYAKIPILGWFVKRIAKALSAQ
jgi:hypothetical protein